MQVSYGRDSLAPVFLQLPLRDYLAAILPGLATFRSVGLLN